jgi:hypothetical protein
LAEIRVGDWVKLLRPPPEEGYSSEHHAETWQRRRDDPSLVVHVMDFQVYCVEPLSKPERNAHEYWSAPAADVELLMRLDGPCPFLTCLVATQHFHAVCSECGAVRYGNAYCQTCKANRHREDAPA